MALFKIFKGNSANLETNRPARQEGFIYLTQDDMKFYIDLQSSTNTTAATLTDTEKRYRKPLNASKADMLQAWYTDPKDRPGRWTVQIPGIDADSFVDGLTIRIRLSTDYAQNSQGYNTLEINGLGPKALYHRYNQLLTNQVSQWTEVLLTYHKAHTMVSSVDGTTNAVYGCRSSDFIPSVGFYANTNLGTDGWVIDAAFSDGNNYERLWNMYEARTAGSEVFPEVLCMIDSAGKIRPIVTTASAGNNKEPNSTPFLPYRILYHAGTSSVAQGSYVTNLYEDVPITSMSNSLNSQMTAYSDLYLCGELTEQGLFLLDETDYYAIAPNSIAVPANTFVKGKYYIYVGASDGTTGHLQLLPSHPFFYCDDETGTTLKPSIIGQQDTSVDHLNGVLPIAKGGSGLSVSPSMLVALGSNNPDNVFQQSPSPGVTGVLGVANGGTGVQSLTAGQVLIGNGTAGVQLRAITNNTTATAVSATDNLITENTLYYHTGNTNLTTLGTITTGTWEGTTIAIAHGGTGMTTNPSMLINLESNNPDSVFQMSTAPGVSGVLGTRNGGTGCATHTQYHMIWAETATKLASTPYMYLDYSEGTLAANGYESLVLGNSIKTGVLKNAYGRLSLYSKDESGSYIIAADSDEWKEHVLPAANGWLVTSGNGSTTGAGSTYVPVYVTTTGTAIACSQPSLLIDLASDNPCDVFVASPSPGVTGILPSKHGGSGVNSHTANRLVWSTSATTIQATNDHYVSATKLGVNYNVEPDYNLHVHGTSYVSDESYFDGDSIHYANVYIDSETTDWKTSNKIQFRVTKGGITGISYIAAYQTPTSSAKSSLVIQGNGACFIGSGDGAKAIHDQVITQSGNEHLYLCSDGSIYIYTGADDKTERIVIDSTPSIYPSGNGTGNVGTATFKWNNMHTKQLYCYDDLWGDCIRLVDNYVSFYGSSVNSGTRYGYIQVDDAYMYFRKENGNNGFSFNGHLLPDTNNTYNIGSPSLRWANLYLNGNLVMNDLGTPATYPKLSNKITWSGGSDGAEIYYTVASEDAGRLTFNLTDDTNCLIGYCYNGAYKAYLNPSSPSFYPATPNTGSLGLATSRWGTIYGNTFNINGELGYGDYGLPIYWSGGVPVSTYPIQYAAFVINSGETTAEITKTGKYFADTFVLQIVVLLGEQYLNGAITWSSAANKITLTTAATSGKVEGYILTARGHNLDA